MAAQAKSSSGLPQIITLLAVVGLIVGLVITAIVSVAFRKSASQQGHVDKAHAGKTEGSSSASSCRTGECLHQDEKREAPPPPPPLCLEEKFDKLPKHFLTSELPVHLITKGGKHCFLKCMDEPPPPCIIREPEVEEETSPPEDDMHTLAAEDEAEEEEKEVTEDKETEKLEALEEGEELEEKEEEAEEEALEENEDTEDLKEGEEEKDEVTEKDVEAEDESKTAEGEAEAKSEIEEEGDEEAGETEVEGGEEAEEPVEASEAEEVGETEKEEAEHVCEAEEGGEAEEGDEVEEGAEAEEGEVREGSEATEEGEAEDASEGKKETEATGDVEEAKTEDETSEIEVQKDEGEQEEAEVKEIEIEKEAAPTEEASQASAEEEAEVDEEGEKEEKSKEDSEDIEKESEAEQFEEIFEHKRITDYIDELLHLNVEDMTKQAKLDKYANDILKRLQKIYQNTIKPVEKTYKYTDLYGYTVSDGEIFSKPMILVIGPWSSGKSAFINYLLDTETGSESLLIGAEPTTTDFTIIQNGVEFRAVDGPVLTQDDSFSALEKFGQTFLERLKGFQFNRQILKKMTIIDTPGIIEGQERSYPFSDVCQWFIDHSDLILVLFDPTKLDVGNELDEVFKKLKGRESQIRVILNKADSIAQQELMRVYGALYWSLSQLIENLEPPRVYVGSFWSKPFKSHAPVRLFLDEEVSLLKDFNDVFDHRVMNKIGMFRQHAIRVRNHALLVDKYLSTYNSHNSFFGNSKEIARDIIQNPNKYRIYQAVSMQTNVSKFDLPDPKEYEEFFAVNPLNKFKSLASQCSYFRGCPLDKLDHAVIYDLPDLLVEARDSRDKQCGTGKFKCPADEGKKRRLVKRR